MEFVLSVVFFPNPRLVPGAHLKVLLENVTICDDAKKLFRCIHLG